MEGYTISFRFTADLFQMDIFDHFLKENSIVVRKSSMGLHEEECATRHYHYHLWTDNSFQFKSPPTQMFKNKNKSLAKVFKENSNSLSIKVSKVEQVSPTAEEGEEGEIYDGEIKDIRRFLNYPLKENKPVEQYCKGIDVSQSCLEGAAEWAAVLTYRKKLKARKLAEETKKGQLYGHLDANDYRHTGLYGVVKDTLLFYKGNKDAPHPQYQIKSAEIYAYHKGIWSIDDIMARYLPKREKPVNEMLKDLGLLN